MSEQERLENFLAKFTAYAAQVEITDDTMKRDNFLDKITKPLRESVRASLDTIHTFADLRKKLNIIFWDMEAGKKRNPRMTSTSTPATTTKYYHKCK